MGCSIITQEVSSTTPNMGLIEAGDIMETMLTTTMEAINHIGAAMVLDDIIGTIFTTQGMDMAWELKIEEVRAFI